MKRDKSQKDLLKSIAYGKYLPGELKTKLFPEYDVKSLTDAQLEAIVAQQEKDLPDEMLDGNNPIDREILQLRKELRAYESK